MTALHGGSADRDPTTLPSFAALFEDVARSAADLLAVDDGTVTFTYAQLERRSAAIATAIQRESADDASPVAVLATCDAQAFATDLGVIRSGRPIVVLDRMVPVARMQAILEISGATLMLTDAANHELAASVVEGTTTRLLTSDELVARLADPAGARPAAVDPESLAVIIFTSGSTGTPKGVMWTQRFLASDCLASAEPYHYSPGERAVTSFPISFTGGMLASMCLLTWGASLHLCDPRVVGAAAFLDFVRSSRATLVSLTPSMLRGLLRIMRPDEVLPDVRILSTGGEALYSADVEATRPHLPDDALFVQGFGSSEAGSVTGIEFARTDPVPAGAVPVGYPRTWRSLRVVDDEGRTLGPDEPGELVVRTRIAASGYWREPEKSAARFVQLGDGTIDLRTGDMASIAADGLLRILGRSEAAVKVRGYLVDPSEIEAALLASGRVSETVVVAVTEDGQSHLVGYFVPKPGMRTPSVAELRAWLALQLPMWMVPAHLVPLIDLPRNAGGKIDRVNLPPVPPRRHEPPVGPTESAVAEIWSQVLGVDQVGRADDFYALGGDSLAAEEMLARVHDALGVSVLASDFTQATMLADFVASLAGDTRTVARPRWPGTTIELRKGTSGRTVFCIAGAAQSSVAFVPIASMLDTDDAIVVLQTRGFERHAPAQWSFRAMVRTRLAAIRRIQPNGPYVLVGHSLGALLALEIGRRLEEEGERVVGVLLDPMFTGNAAMGTSAENFVDFMVDPFYARPGRAGRAVQTAKAVSRTALLPAAGLVPARVDARHKLMFRQSGLVARRHRPRPWAGQVLAYRTADNVDPAQVWNRLLPRAAVRELPSDHNSLLRSPYIEVVVADLHRALAAETAA